MYLIQAWDKDNKRWGDGGCDLIDLLCKTKTECKQEIKLLADGWDCPVSDLRCIKINNTHELEQTTGITPLVGDPSYEILFSNEKK